MSPDIRRGETVVTWKPPYSLIVEAYIGGGEKSICPSIGFCRENRAKNRNHHLSSPDCNILDACFEHARSCVSIYLSLLTSINLHISILVYLSIYLSVCLFQFAHINLSIKFYLLNSLSLSLSLSLCVCVCVYVCCSIICYGYFF